MKRLLMLFVVMVAILVIPNSALAGAKGYIIIEDGKIVDGEIGQTISGNQIVRSQPIVIGNPSNIGGHMISVTSNRPEKRYATIPRVEHYHTITGPTQEEMARWRRQDMALLIGGGFFAHNNPDYWWIPAAVSVVKNANRQKINNRQITLRNGQLYDISYGGRSSRPYVSYNGGYRYSTPRYVNNYGYSGVPSYYYNVRPRYSYAPNYISNRHYDYIPYRPYRNSYRSYNTGFGYGCGMGLGGLGGILQLPFSIIHGLLGGIF